MSDDTHNSNGELADIPCTQLVELVTDYLDDALDTTMRARVDAHLTYCDGCTSVLAQFREVVELSGRLTEADVDGVDSTMKDGLLAAFRESRRT